MGSKKTSGYKIAGIIVKTTDQIFSFVIGIILILLLLYSVYGIWDSRQVSDAADSSSYTTYKPDEENTESFESLRAKNPEVFAWLTIDKTPIDYADNNAKYINTNAKGEYSLSGSLFLDYRNANDFSDPVSIIYGHDMAEGKMFGSLDQFSDSSFFEEHRYGSLFFNEKYHQIEVIAFFETDAYNNNIYDPEIKSDDLLKYTDMVFKSAVQKRNIDINENSRIIMLSTCNTAKTNGRCLLMCKLL